MIKIIIFLAGLGCVNIQGMLKPRDTLGSMSLICSIASNYCVVKGIDEWSHSTASRQNKKKLQSLLFTAAGLRLASLLFATPKLITSDKSKVVSWAVKEMGALYMGAGFYLLESAFRKYRSNAILYDEAMQDFCLASIFTIAGSLHIVLPHLCEDVD